MPTIINSRSDLDSAPADLKARHLRSINRQRTDNPAILSLYGFDGDADFAAYASVAGWVMVKPEPSPEPTPPSLAERQAAALARLAERRWAYEVGGLVYEGSPIHTDRLSRAAIHENYVLASADEDFATQWKCADGSWLPLDREGMAGLFATAAAHRQAGYAREAALAALIEAAGDDDALAMLDTEIEAFEV